MTRGSSTKARRDDHLWALMRAERAALAEDLSTLSPEQWRNDTLRGQWDVEQVVAHLTAAGPAGDAARLSTECQHPPEQERP